MGFKFDDHTQSRPKRVDLRDAVTSGNARDQLVALRDYLAESLEDCVSPRDQAPLAAQLRQVLIDLESMPVEGEASTVDDLAHQRALRRAAAFTA